VENELQNSTTSTVKRTTNWIIALALISIVTPFIYMKIGPNGIKYYGKNVPDIYILGGYILGKDTSFWGINFAYKFQLLCIAIIVGLTYFYNINKKVSYIVANLVLLFCFPFWLSMYIGGVKCNSDGAASDLTVYPMPGLILWGVIFILHIMLFMNHLKANKIN
jgi:hypothetical protein